VTALLHSHDGDGTPLPADGRHRTSVHVRGGVGATRVDVAELRHIEGRLEEVVQDTAQLAAALSAAQRDLALDATLAPGAAVRAEAAVDAALHGWWGVHRLNEEAGALLVALRYARVLYEEAELAAHVRGPAPSWVGYLRLLVYQLSLLHAGVSVGGRLALVGRLPGFRPRTPGQALLAGAGALVNAVVGDEHLPPDAVALDRAVRELGEHGQYVIPWFLVPRPFTYDGRRLDPDALTAAQQLVIPVTMGFHGLTGRTPGTATDLRVTVAPSRLVSPAPDLPAVLTALHDIHQDHGAAPGTLEVRRTDHPDGTRSWTVLLPSTQAMAPGGRNPVDNLTNVEAYGELVSDVEIGAARAMELAGIRPGEPVAVVGFSQGGLVAARLAADPLLRHRFTITTVVTAGSPVGHLRTPADTELLHLEHVEDPILGLDGASNPAEPARTTVSRSLATGTTGELRFAVPPAESHSIAEYARTAELALAAGEPSVTHVARRLAAISGGPGARVTATAYTLERG